MKYPMLAKWLHFEQKDSEWFRVTNLLSGEVCFMTAHMASFARKLDGNTPPQLLLPPERRREAEDLVAELDQWDLLRYNRTLEKGWGTFYWTLFFFDDNVKFRKLFQNLNAFLLLLFIPCLLAGLMTAICCAQSRPGFSLLGLIFGSLLGMIIHETAHMIAGIAYHAAVYECGVMIDHFLPGAYAIVDTKTVQSKTQVLQINGAGLEANILLAGLFLMFTFPESCGSFFLWMAIGNVLLAVFNLFPVSGLDGIHMLETLLETDHLYGKVTRIIRNRKIKQRLKYVGLQGYLVLCICYLILTLNFIWRFHVPLSIALLLFWSFFV